MPALVVSYQNRPMQVLGHESGRPFARQFDLIAKPLETNQTIELDPIVIKSYLSRPTIIAVPIPTKQYCWDRELLSGGIVRVCDTEPRHTAQ